jgi:hypothetical protein
MSHYGVVDEAAFVAQAERLGNSHVLSLKS